MRKQVFPDAARPENAKCEMSKGLFDRAKICQKENISRFRFQHRKIVRLF